VIKVKALTELEVLQKIEWAVKEEDKLKRLLTMAYDDMTRKFYRIEIEHYIHIKESMRELLMTMKEVNEDKF
jgi:hypothetical protein